MKANTPKFGEIDIPDEKILRFEDGLVGFPNLKDFTLIRDIEEEGALTVSWLQSMQEPGFALPVMDPLLVVDDYNPPVEDELLKSIGDIKEKDLLVLVTLSVPHEIEKMTVNLKGPIIINVGEHKAVQVVIEDAKYKVKFPIYEILKSRKEGE